MTLIDGDRIITAQLYDDEHEEYIEKKMSIIDYINAYTDEGVTEADVVEQTEWIPVSERLPSRDEYIKNNGLFIVSDGNRSYSEWYDIYDTRRFGEPTMSGFRIDYVVTAWMPLPKPYEPQESDLGDYPDAIHNQFDNMTGSMNL